VLRHYLPTLYAAAIVAAAASVFSGDQAALAQQLRVLGLDVSAWQGEITTTEWATLKRPTNQQVGGVFGDGRDFVFIRSSRGGTTGYYDQSNSDNNPPTNTLSQRYDDPYYIQNITRATNAGLLAGTYHFSRPDVVASTTNSGGIANNGTDEANHFIQMAGPWMRPGYLLPVHDLEAGDGIRSDNDMAQFAIDFSDRIYEVMGIRPAIYTNGNYAQNVVGGATAALRYEVVEKYPTLWSARWPNQPNPGAIDVQNSEPKDSFANIYGPWDDSGVEHPWSFWQYASTMKLNGNNNKSSNTDVNVAHGGIEFVKDKLVPALWMNDSSGDWNTLTNWNSGQTPVAPVQGPGQVGRIGAMTLPTPRLPGADDVARHVDGQNDTVILDRPNASITVTLSSGAHNIRKLYAREALNVTGGSLTINYVPSWDSTPISAQFSAPVSLSGGASFSVHTLQVDATQTFTAGDASLAFKAINLMPGARESSAKLLLGGDVSVSPLGGESAVIATGAGTGSAGVVDLGGASRTITVADGAAAVDLAVNVPIVNGGLIKAGAGTLALSGANTYAGNTAVNAGTLRLASTSLADAASLYLSTGATIDLAFAPAAADTIYSLFIDGVLQPAGAWGAVGSGAQFTSPLIIGSGTLQVTTLAGDFNGDQLVDSTDLDILTSHFGAASGANLSMGDADADGDVDGGDWVVWQQSQGAPGTPAAAVPEPAAALLLLTAGALAAAASRRSRA
jgi:autotransporter-associated beta strand protein